MAYTTETDVYNRTGLSASEVNLTTNTNIIADAEAELELLTGRKFTNGVATTEYITTPRKNIFETYTNTVQLRLYPVQSITGCQVMNVDGTVNTSYGTLTSVQVAAGTFETTDYWLDVSEDAVSQAIVPTGKITFKTVTIPTGTNKLKVAYTYGYATVPVIVRDLATCLAGIRMWITFLGGQYNRFDSYSIPQQTVSKGDFYSRGKQNIEVLQDEVNRLLDRIGRRTRTLFVGSG